MRAKEFINEHILSEDTTVVYHGTNNQFVQFDRATLGTSTGDPNAVLGHFFTSSEREARLYGKYVISATLTLNNPYEATMDELVGLDEEDYMTMREELISSGYDGIIAPHDDGPDMWYVVFSADQINIIQPKQKSVNEAASYHPPKLNVGDKILKGKFKNSPAEIKGFTKDKHNQPVLKTNKGEVQLFKPRISKLMKEDEPTRIKIGGAEAAAKARAWIEQVYAKYPQTMQNNHVMTWGSGDDLQFAMFELTPSFSKRGAVEVKWIQAYPLRQGVGSRAMKELQALAREEGISLTLFPWDKGQVSQSKLTKFYRGQGFSPTVKGGKAMQWSPELSESLRVDVPNEEWLNDAIAYAKQKSPTHYGLPYMGKTTATVRQVEVPLMLLRQIPGMRREQQNVRQEDLAAIMKIMSDTGKLPIHAHSGEEYKPFINVAYDGSAWVNEGNHRIMAAYRLGWDSLPVEISYFDGGERVESGPMYPGKIGL